VTLSGYQGGMKIDRRAVPIVLSVLALLFAAAPAGASVRAATEPVTGWRVEGVASDVVVAGGRTYVAGSFSRVVGPGGTTRARANLAAFDTRTGALLEDFRADANGPVRALASDGDTVWVGGEFTAIGGSARGRLAAVDARTGGVRSFRADASGFVYALDLAGGRLFVGGSFQSVSGQARSRAAAVDPRTGALHGWRPDADHTVLALAARADGGLVFLGGTFGRAGRAPRSGIAAVDGSTGAATAAVFAGVDGPPLDLALDDGGSRLFAGLGGTDGVGDAVGAWDTSSGRQLWRHAADGDVQAVAHHRGVVYFGFHEGFRGDRSIRLLAANASDGGLDGRFRPSFDRFWGVYAIAVTDHVVAAGGDFTRVSGVPAQGLVQFPADGGGTPSPSPTPDPAPPSFSDIAGDTHAESIRRAAAAGVVTGFPDGTFRPGQSLSRGQMAAILARALSLPTGAAGAFVDVGGHTHERAIGALAAAGIAEGYGDGTYRPDDHVSRAEMATFLMRAFELPPDPSTRYSDVSGAHAGAIGAVSNAGIARGYPDDTFRPTVSVSRAQTASFLVVALGI
jgi:hypothetical protein